MITSKQRKTLSGIGQTLEPVFQIGKNGITDTVLATIEDALEAREIVKLSVLRNCDDDARDVLGMICEELNAEPVSCVGSKIVLYRRSSRKNFNHIEF